MRKTYVLLGLFVITLATAFLFSGNHPDGSEEEEEEGFMAKQDRINFAVQQEFELTKDPQLMRVPRERLLEADRIRNEKLFAEGNQRAVGGIGWEERGPGNVGGRTRALLYDLNDAANGYKKVWAGSVGGGLWFTNDITASAPQWERANDFMGNLAITTIAQNPANTQELYIGTGEGWFNLDAIQGLGIWKSSDGGLTWSQLSATNNSNFYFIQKIAVTSAGVVLATTRSNGLYRSADGGTSWTKVLGSGVNGATSNRAADIEIASNGYIYCSIGIFSTDGIYRSADNGLNWTKIYSAASDESRIELACAPGNSNVVYAMIEDNNGADNILGTSDDNGIKKLIASTNAAAAVPAWNTMTTPGWCDNGANGNADFTRGQAWYDLIALVDPTNENTMYIGGVDIHKTTNAGTAWTQLSQWGNNCSAGSLVHADIHALVMKPGSATEFLVGSDGGVYRTTDAGASFAYRNSSYNVTQLYACAIHPSSTNYFLAGAQDNGSQKFSAGGINNTTTASGGDGGFCHIDQDNPSIQITSYVFNNYYVSTDGGASFSSFSKNNNGQFINPTDYDDAGNILYGADAAGNYFRWANPATNGTSNTVSVAAFSSAKITHVAVSPITANRVYFGLDNGSLVRVNSANTGTTATGTVIKTGLAGTSITCIAIDPANEDHMLVTYGGYGITSLYESFNATQASPTWTSVEGDLPDMPVRWVMFDPRNTDWALIATELGIWSTDNLNGASTKWNPTNAGLSNVRVDMLQYRSSDRTIAAATHGRGLYTATVPSSTTPTIHFTVSSASGAEKFAGKTGCRPYKDYTVNMMIDNPPTGNANITLGIQAGATATQGMDYDLTTNNNFSSPSSSFVFLSDSVNAQAITVRVYDDRSVEGIENFTLNYSISGTTNAVAGAGNQTCTFTIVDDDNAPGSGSSNSFLVGALSGSSNGQSPFLSLNQRAKFQYLFTAAELIAAGLKSGPLSALSFTVTSKSSSVPFGSFTLSLGNTNESILTGGFVSNSLTQVYSGNLLSSVGVNTINFTTPFAWDGVSNLIVQTCFDNGAVNAAANDFVEATLNPIGSNIWCTAYTASNSPAAICTATASSLSTIRPRIRFTQTFGQTPVESTLNSVGNVYLGPNADIYIYSSVDNELIGRIQNLSSFDYGCTEVTVDREGAGAVAFWNNNAGNFLASKTIRVVPTNSNGGGQYTITLYYSQTEKTGWEAVTGQNWNNIQLVKVPGRIADFIPGVTSAESGSSVQVSTPVRSTIGNIYALSYTFTTGFSGFGAGIPGMSALPVTLISFKGQLQENSVLLEWTTGVEQHSKNFEVERSTDGSTYATIGKVNAAGNSVAQKQYSFRDRDLSEVNYYRLRINDIDGHSRLSNVVMVRYKASEQQVWINGNPFKDYIDLGFARSAGEVKLQLVSSSGAVVLEKIFSGVQKKIRWQMPSFITNGAYVLRTLIDGQAFTNKLVRH